MYIISKEIWSKIHVFLLKSFRSSSSAVLDDGRMGIRMDAEPGLFEQIIKHAMPENAEPSEQGTQFEYVPEKEYPISYEPEHVYSVDPDIIPYVEKVEERYLYGGKTEGNTVRINAGNDVFSKIVARAYCEKRTADEGVNFATEEEVSNKSYISALFEATPSFAVVPIHVAPSELFSENTVPCP